MYLVKKNLMGQKAEFCSSELFQHPETFWQSETRCCGHKGYVNGECLFSTINKQYYHVLRSSRRERSRGIIALLSILLKLLLCLHLPSFIDGLDLQGFS